MGGGGASILPTAAAGGFLPLVVTTACPLHARMVGAGRALVRLAFIREGTRRVAPHHIVPDEIHHGDMQKCRTGANAGNLTRLRARERHHALSRRGRTSPRTQSTGQKTRAEIGENLGHLPRASATLRPRCEPAHSSSAHRGRSLPRPLPDHPLPQGGRDGCGVCVRPPDHPKAARAQGDAAPSGREPGHARAVRARGEGDRGDRERSHRRDLRRGRGRGDRRAVPRDGAPARRRPRQHPPEPRAVHRRDDGHAPLPGRAGPRQDARGRHRASRPEAAEPLPHDA